MKEWEICLKRHGLVIIVEILIYNLMKYAGIVAPENLVVMESAGFGIKES